MACPDKLSPTSGCEFQPEQESGRSVDDGGRWAKFQRLSAVTSPGLRVCAPGRDLSGRSIKQILLLRYITKPKGGKAEPHMGRAKAKHCVKNPKCSAGLSWGIGNGTIGRLATEQERPSWTALRCVSRAYKAEPKTSGVQRESDESVVPMIWKTTKLPVGKGLYLGQACSVPPTRPQF